MPELSTDFSSIALSLILLAAGLAVLSVSADKLVGGLQDLAGTLKVAPVLVAVLLLALGTSLPELVVSIEAVREQQATIAVGNLLGSNIANALLIGGMALVLSGGLSAQITNRQMLIVMAMISLPVLALWLSAYVVTAILLVGGVFGVVYLCQQNSGQFNEPAADSGVPLWKSLVITLVSIVFLLLSARLSVESAVTLGTAVGLSPLFIGGVILAIGTSLPELAATVAALRRNAPDVVIGNLLGSMLLNVTLLLGLTLGFNKLLGGPDAYEGITLLLVGSIVAVGLFFAALRLRKSVRLIAGGSLIALYGAVSLGAAG